MISASFFLVIRIVRELDFCLKAFPLSYTGDISYSIGLYKEISPLTGAFRSHAEKREELKT